MINKLKSIAICPGNPKKYGESFEGIRFSSSLFILGVHFKADMAVIDVKENWEQRITKVERILTQWSKRGLSIIGKIHIIKTFALSGFVHLMQSIGMPDWVEQKLNTLFFRFLWKNNNNNTKAHEKVKRKVLCNEFEYGGLEM